MSIEVTITVRLVQGAPDGEERHRVRRRVARGTPAGAGWSYVCEDAALDLVPPPGITYVLNGRRTIPAARLDDGDDLVIVLPALLS